MDAEMRFGMHEKETAKMEGADKMQEDAQVCEKERIGTPRKATATKDLTPPMAPKKQKRNFINVLRAGRRLIVIRLEGPEENAKLFVSRLNPPPTFEEDETPDKEKRTPKEVNAHQASPSKRI